ncbi:UNVERIFIED_CONTAM: Histone-lysine N-methyltransferase ASHH3 [Sesamum indicum]
MLMQIYLSFATKQSLTKAMPAVKKNAECIGIRQVFNKLVKEIGSPVDFELPESFNKWKPTSYSFIRRNVYLTKKMKRRLEDDGIFCSCSSSAGSSGVCGKDCLCSMLMSSCSSGCKCGSSCVNKPFQQRPMKKMKTVLTEKCGMGVVAEEDINQGEFVIEYVGEVIDDKTCEERLWKMKHSGETNFYLCEINRDMVIDATYKGNKSRYINHSCSPNTEMQKWMIDGETRIGIFATRDIKKGEHLTYDYQFVQFGADQDCYCGAAGCRKKLGVKPNKPKVPFSDAELRIAACQMAANSPEVKAVVSNKPVCMNGVPGVGGPRHNPSQQKKRRLNCIGSVIRIFHFSDKRSFGIIRRFDNTRRKHLIMFEDGYSEFLDLAKEEWEFCNC